MAKFLNKKEQVFDFKLTSYGRYLLSIGSFKPTYYAFFDDNITYDNRYMVGKTPATDGLLAAKEGQNNVNKRIKQDTPYLESLVLFRDVDDYVSRNSTETINFLDVSLTPTKVKPDADVFQFNAAIGDAYLDGETNDAAPAWQVLMLQNNISSSAYRTKVTANTDDPLTSERPDAPGMLVGSSIPQINVKAIYKLKIAEPLSRHDAKRVTDLKVESPPFADGKVMRLEYNDPIVYLDEVNTQLLAENFDIEVFDVQSGSLAGFYNPTLERKYFKKNVPQIENGFMVSPNPINVASSNLTTSSVEYYFDVITDGLVDQTAACQGIEVFSKKGYYINLDFNCETETEEAVFYDIYGSVTEPEICQS